MPYLQILPVSGARLTNLFRLLALIGLLSYPFQADLRTPTERSTMTLADGRTVKGIVEEYRLRGELRGYQIRNADLPEGGAPTGMKALGGGAYFVAAEDVKDVSPVYSYNLKGILTFPFRFLLIFNLVWLLHLPALLFWPVYEAAGAAATFFNMVHALITEQNHQELSRFLMRVHNYRWKLFLSLNGDQLPHVDIFGRERTKLPLRFTATIESDFSRMQVLARLAVPLLLYALYTGWKVVAALFQGPLFLYITLGLLALLLIPFLLFFPAQLLLWIILSLKRPAPQWLLEILYRPQRFLLHVSCWWQGLTSNSGVIVAGWKSVSANGNGNFDPSQGSKLEMNLLVLLLLILFSGGLYALTWTGRTARMMQDDPFTIILVSVIGGLLPLSFLMARYYRRGEIMLKTPPSWLVEILMMIPLVNLVLGPFVIQYGLNLFAKAQAKPE